jgi:hypothetical protein
MQSTTDLIREIHHTYPDVPSGLNKKIEATKALLLNVNYDYETKKIQRFLSKIFG